MIIDEIMDRKEGNPYSAKDFYDYATGVSQVWPEIGMPIASALDCGSDEDVKKQLCKYVLEQGYNEELCNYINNVKWVND